ncbi:MAG TPA: XdhC family protein [Longimicrobium sp.]
MRAELLKLAAEMAAQGEAFALATVVRREAPSSAQVGNVVIITAAGEFHGWLGGSCIRPTVLREAIAAIRDARPRLISISPDPEAARRPGVTVFAMTCHSGGSVEIYVEPMLPAPRLAVFGATPVARALAGLGREMGYAVETVDAPSPHPPALHGDAPRFAVVATQGEGDEEAVEAALALDPAYLGVVASRRRFAEMREMLIARGADPARLDRIRNPAGLDLGAATPEEVALSILAEIVQLRRASAEVPPDEAREEPAAPETALDPVCGMTVDVATARHTAEHGGATVYFCCAGCRTRFLAEPGWFIAAPAPV